MENLTTEQVAKIETFQEHLANFDWNRREDFGKDWIALMRESLEAAGLDFNSRESIDGFMNNVVEPFWKVLGQEEKEISDQMRVVFRAAGATEAQLTWGMVENVPITRRQERKTQQAGKGNG